jgi:hypothetical protein
MLQRIKWLSITACLLIASCGPDIDSKKLGLSPADKAKFDSSLSQGNLFLTLGIVAVVVGVAILLVGVWFQMKKAKARIK